MRSGTGPGDQPAFAGIPEIGAARRPVDSVRIRLNL